GTGVTKVSIDLSATAGSGQGDGAVDTVNVAGTGGNDSIKVVSSGTSINVNGLPAQVTIAGAEAANDQLAVNGGGGDDTIDASGLNAGQINLTLNGGAGNDLIKGSAGNDTVIGGQGNDVALLGAGDDTFVWNPGDGSDIVEGQAGQDTLLFNGANIAERVELTANGKRGRFTRDVASITMDFAGVERFDFNALGGADTVHAGDPSGPGMPAVDVPLGRANAGGGDGAADTVTLDGTGADDVIVVGGSSGALVAAGLSTQLNITGAEAANDRLVVNAFGGEDVID